MYPSPYAPLFLLLLAGEPLLAQQPGNEPSQPAPPAAPSRPSRQAGGGNVRAPQPPPDDPIGENLFPPDLVMQFQARIGLSDEQQHAIMSEMQRAQPKFEKLERQIQQEAAALSLLLRKDRVELGPALAQSDKLSEIEREMQRTQLTLLIGLKNRLTPEQQAQLQGIKKQQSPGGAAAGPPPQAIQEKMQKLQAAVRQWQQNGRDLSSLGQAMQQFEPLIRSGQFKEAEAVLDNALKLLEEKKPR